MNDETKQKINARYERELNKGERFWPDSIFKDLIVSLGLFVLLIILATFIGVAPELKADPSDTSYVPRPEWYFLFIFKFLAIYGQIPVLGTIEWIAAILIPSIALGLLTLLPFIEKSPDRHYVKRILPISIMIIMVVGIVLLTLTSEVPTVAADGSKLLGILQAVSGLVIPTLAYIALIVTFYAFQSDQLTSKIVMGLTTVIACVAMMITSAIVLYWHSMTVAVVTTVIEEPIVATTLVDQIVAGQDLYAVNCTECHGDDGSIAVIEGVEGLEGEEITPINSKDVLYTITDSAMYEVIAYGRPNAGMTPFGKAYGGELSKSEIDYMIVFMRYMWDDRFEAPTIKPLYPPLAEGEVPSYDVHIAPISKRYCVSCHRADKENNNYLMTSYDEILTTGDNADKNIIPGDETSYFLQVIQEQAIMDPDKPDEELIGVMPPSKALKPDVINVFKLWIMNGMPQTAEDAKALSTTATPAP